MIQFANCKINLGLHITNKRTDGYHNIDTVFYPIGLQDAIEFVESEELKFESSGIDIPGDPQQNIILKAYRLLKHDFPSLPNLHIHLHKVIPTGGGLAGGSSNAVTMLKMLDEYFSLGLFKNKIGNADIESNKHSLWTYAAQLGSDCPFFLFNSTCHAEGRGEILTPLTIDLSAYFFMLVFPSLHINTAWAFTQLDPKRPLKSTSEIVQQPIESWKNELKNDFENAIFERYPILQTIKTECYNLGAVYSAMSGSGSTIYGIFKRSELQMIKQKLRGAANFQGSQMLII